MLTPVYSWHIPDRGGPFWALQAERLFTQIDVTVHSVESLTRCRRTLALSAYIQGSGVTLNAASNAIPEWVALSSENGRFVGHFTVQRSGSQMMLEVDHSFFVGPGFTGPPVSLPTATTRWFYRFIIDPPSGSLPHPTHVMSTFAIDAGARGNIVQMHKTWAGSLAPGNYDLFVDVRGLAMTGCATTWRMPQGTYMTVHATEVWS